MNTQNSDIIFLNAYLSRIFYSPAAFANRYHFFLDKMQEREGAVLHE